ncbi:MAG: (d)CMP kinase [Bacteroidota bacterium]
MTEKKLVIAIDGPAASGKTTTARLVAVQLGYLHLDTGAMYRAVTLKVLRTGLNPHDEVAIAQLIRTTHVELHRQGNDTEVLLDGDDVSDEIRSVEVTKAVSAVSGIRRVREAMVQEQRRMAEGRGVVLEGRDIGTVVFPEADLKIFMGAGLESRARRRQSELERRGIKRDVAEFMKEIEERDRRDSTREASPLKRAEDAIVLDTSNMSIQEQVDFVVKEAVRVFKNKS